MSTNTAAFEDITWDQVQVGDRIVVTPLYGNGRLGIHVEYDYTGHVSGRRLRVTDPMVAFETWVSAHNIKRALRIQRLVR